MNKHLHGRVPIPKGGTIKLDGHELIYENIDSSDEIAVGSSCLVYHVHTENLGGTNYVLKEFYPILENGNITRDPVTNKLFVDDTTKQSTEYQMRLKQFMQGIARADELSAWYEIVVPHILDGTAGDSFYMVTANTTAKNLKENTSVVQSFAAKLEHLLPVFEPFIELQDLGYLMLDIKPDNLLDDLEYNRVLIVDTDSILAMDDKISDLLLLSNAKYAAPEVRNLQLFTYEDAVEIANDILTPYATMYSIGQYLFEYFWEEPFTKKNLYDYNLEYLLNKFVELYFPYTTCNLMQDCDIKELSYKFYELFLENNRNIDDYYNVSFLLGKFAEFFFSQKDARILNRYLGNIEKTLKTYVTLYYEHRKDKLRDIGFELISALKNVLIEDLMERICVCYNRLDIFRDTLEQLRFQYLSLIEHDSSSQEHKELSILFSDPSIESFTLDSILDF